MAGRALRRIAQWLETAGVDARPINRWTCWQLRLNELLKLRGVQTVLDVGASDGGYAAELIRYGYHGSILSFEPLPHAWLRLRERALPHALQWTVAPRMALSDRGGEAEFHEAGNGVSSSLLAMTEWHREAAPGSATVGTIFVRTERLEDVIDTSDATPHFLKIDVQGAERQVLEGAGNLLGSTIVGVQLEMSLVSLYEGQPHAAELDELLRSRGFDCWDLIPVFRDPDTLRLLQYDGVYFRR